MIEANTNFSLKIQISHYMEMISVCNIITLCSIPRWQKF